MKNAIEYWHKIQDEECGDLQKRCYNALRQNAVESIGEKKKEKLNMQKAIALRRHLLLKIHFSFLMKFHLMDDKSLLG